MTNNWSDWQNAVLGKLDTHDGALKDFNLKIDHQSNLITDVRIEIAKLKVRASIWGSVAGAIGAGIILILQLVL